MDSLRVCVLQLLLTCLLTSGSDVSDVVNTSVGQSCNLTVTLPVGEVLVLEWTRAGLEVFFYRDGKIESEDERVQLRDPELKDETLIVERGQITVTLKDVKLEDAGTYVCEALVQTSGGREERFTREVHLRVSERTEDARSERREGLDMGMPDSDVPDAAKGTDLALILGVTLSAVAVVVCAVAAGLCWKIRTIKDQPQKRKIPETSDSPPTTPTESSTPLVSPSAV